MAVFKIEKNKNYTVMSNYHLQDRNLSYKAKGLLSFMLSLPDDWDYSLKGLCKISKENETSIKTGLKELKDYGYLVIDKLFPNQTQSGKIEYRYNIYEIPITLNQEGENLPLEIQSVENQRQINTNIINTNNKEDKLDKQISSFFNEKEHHILTIDLIKLGYIKEDDMRIFDYDELFNEYMNNGVSYRDLIKVVNYTCSRIVDRKFKDEDGIPIKNKYSYLRTSINDNLDRINLELDDLWEDYELY
ncbi:MAG: helix-turn-helix domain-containing protein [Bacilli bacterium]|nr:helix-turn-helix domain-containing protein [Bacilli bacterium]